MLCNFESCFSFSAYKVTVPAKGRVLCMTDLQVSLPTGCYGRIAPRSGLALKNGIDVGGKNSKKFLYR